MRACDFDRLCRAQPRYDARRFVVEQTIYYDWYYGLRRLYREGSRPDVVVVMLSPLHWSDPIRGDYSAQFLMSAVDLPLAAHDLGIHPTQARNLLFARASKFWGARAEIRNFVLGHLMPNLGEFMSASSAVDRRPIVDAEIEPVLSDRVARMRAVTDAYGSELVLLVPPLLNPEDGSNGLMNAAASNGVPVLRPVTSGSFGAQLYRDGFHLNEVGAAQFTDRLIPALRGELAQHELQASRAQSSFPDPRSLIPDP